MHDAALGRMSKLELDLEQVKRFHAEHSECARTDTSESVVLKKKRKNTP
jgi:hypothetical protein